MLGRRVNAPEAARELCDLVTVNYEDVFEVMIRDAECLDAEDWAAKIFLGAPDALRAFLDRAWSAAGLKSRNESFEDMLISRVVKKKPNAVVLKTRSHLGMEVRVVVYVLESRIGLATFMQLENLTGRLVWSVMAPVHRKIAPYLLACAAQ